MTKGGFLSYDSFLASVGNFSRLICVEGEFGMSLCFSFSLIDLQSYCY